MPPNARALRAIANKSRAFDNLLGAAPRGNVPGVELPVSYGMGGVPDSIQVSEITPRQIFESLYDDPVHAQKVHDRIVERNQGVSRAVEDPELFSQSFDQPITEIVGDYSEDGSAGIWDSKRRAAVSKGGADHPNYQSGDIDIQLHERVHGAIQPDPPTEMRMVDSLVARNDALSDEFQPSLFDNLPEGMLDEQNFEEFATNKRELMNLLFNVKRMSEKLDGVDYGASLSRSDGLGKKIMRSKPDFEPELGYIDPMTPSGELLNGYERQVDYLRELYRASNEYGRSYIREMMHKLGMVGAITAVTAGSENPLGGLADE